jgi:hypothetical protein
LPQTEVIKSENRIPKLETNSNIQKVIRIDGFVKRPRSRRTNLVARNVLKVRRSDNEMKRNAEIGLFTKTSRFDQAIEDQSEKTVPAGGAKLPSQMNPAGGANTHPPIMPSKPGEFLRGRADRPAPLSAPKAADFKNDPMRIGKGVAVLALDADALGRPGDGMQATAAEDVSFLFRRFLLGGGCPGRR